MRRISKIMAAKPFHHAAREEKTLGVFGARGKARVLLGVSVVSSDIGHGIGQQFPGEMDAGVAAGDRHSCCQIAAAAVPGPADTPAAPAELGNASGNIAKRGESLLQLAWQARFPLTPVV